MIWAGTGHRPNKIFYKDKNGYNEKTLTALTGLVRETLERIQPTTVITGMALGFDTALALAALELNIPYWSYVPFIGQEKIWLPSSITRYNMLLEKAEKVEVCFPEGYAPWKMMGRNTRMVDDSDALLALYNGDNTGGTHNCITYAQSKKKEVYNLWLSWEALSNTE